jgi:hypothetical protein
MRLELEAGLKKVRRVNQPWRAWPGGGHFYLYGVYFMQYLDACHGGRDGIRRWVDGYSRDWLPYFINRNAKQAYGQALPGLWKEFKAWLEAGPGAEARAIRLRGLRGAPAPVADGGANGWGPYKAGVALRRDGLTRPRFQALQGGEWRTLGEAYPAYFWPTPQRILYTEDEVHAQSGLTRDLWSMDRASGARQRLTWGLRVQEAVECGGTLLALLGDAGQKRLVRLDGGEVAETLWQGADDENLAGLCPSPDGRRLAAAHWRRAEGWDVEEFDLASRAWLPRASRPESEVQPSYSADGRTLYFSAAYGGTFNVYALDLAGGAVTQLTDVVGGAYHPWPGPEGKVYFSLLTV